MTFNNLKILKEQEYRIANAPEGWDAHVLIDICRAHGRLLHVAREESRLEILERCIAFHDPDLLVFKLPAWDCLPYDRVSPNGEVTSQRLETMARLVDVGPDATFILLTTVNAVLQRNPPRTYFDGATLSLTVGGHHPMEVIIQFLEGNGYDRAGSVRETGEYAVRGGIIDVFPAGVKEPFRLDFFGDDLEGIRTFDPSSQRTVGSVLEARLRPVAELLLDEVGIERFRSEYRFNFGADILEDPLYASVSEGRQYPGMEHWLPLFHETLETVFEYVGDAPVSLDPHADNIAATRFELISEYYDARRSLYESGTADGGAMYRPLPPALLYVDSEEWSRCLNRGLITRLYPFDFPNLDRTGGIQGRDGGARAGVSFATVRATSNANLYDKVREEVQGYLDRGTTVVIAGYTNGSRDRLANLLSEHGVECIETIETMKEATNLPVGTVGATTLPLERGYFAAGFLLIAEPDILGERLSRPSGRRRRRGEEFLHEVSALSEGDFVVHVEHGIGKYHGLETLEIGGAPHDCLRLVYSGNDKLFVPVENIDVLSRYGSEETNAVLDKLGGVAWQARKARVKKRLRDMADQLIRIAAEREVKSTERVAPPPGVYDEFCAKFPYAETDDQIRAINDALDDMARGRPMDRLVCGDVGFGKTEVALRAAMVVAMQGYQVAVVVPTTLLARQHHQVFHERFVGLPIKIRQLSRLVGTAEANEIKQELSAGDCNIAIGTHALLAKSVSFDNLGLVVVDEEQHFGVAQKERLKELRSRVHVLTLTATPIPRTLQLALSGVRDLSLIATPPADRLSIRTFVMPYDDMVIREAIQRERNRGGLAFYVCPRIDDLPRVYDRIMRLVPDARVGSAHGRMGSKELEKVMTAFCDGAFDVLLSTNIVESGLDIPNANTIIIHRADMFGLAQLYQLRGRVGRSKTRAYAYLTIHPTKVLKHTAKRRLEVMQTLDSLGAGFSLASHDMDIRGAGNLLGEEQSGQVKEVGIELYQYLLQEAVHAAREEGFDVDAIEEQWSPQISLGTPVLIPDSYVVDLTVRLGIYRRVARLAVSEEIDAFAAELTDRFGPIPLEVNNLLKVIAMKQLCRVSGVDKVDAGPRGAVISFHNDNFQNPSGLVDFLGRLGGTAQLRTDHKLVYRENWTKPDERMRGLTKLMQDLATIATG